MSRVSSRAAALALSLLAMPAVAFAAAEYLTSDNRSTLVTMFLNTAGFAAPVSPTAGLPTVSAGTTGTDFSVNAATVPLSGFVLLATIPAAPARASAEVQNQSAGTIQVVRDDGAGGNQTSILLASGGLAGSQGGGWSTTTFKGRVRVYGATGAQVAADQE